MNIIFISMQFPTKYDLIKKNSKTMLQYSADAVSSLFSEGLRMQSDVNMKVFNVIPIETWPNGSKSVFIPKISWEAHNIYYEGVSYCNIFGVRQHSKYINIKKCLQQFLEHNSMTPDWVIAYAWTTPILQIFRYIKQKYSNIKTCVIVPDLPQYMNMDGNRFYHYMKSLDIKKQNALMHYVDKLVYFSRYMNDYFKLSNDRWNVIEGAVNCNTETDIINTKDYSKKIILYTGGVEKAYGIDDLIQAFYRIDDKNYELHIIGGGTGVSLVKEALEQDSRIKYLGCMDRQDVLTHQKKATLLVNPRKPGAVFTKYSFPSKILEYMMSGTPVIMHKLEGIPDEYDKYLTYFIDSDPDKMAKQITTLCEAIQLGKEKKGLEARNFVMHEKNNFIQMKKLCDFLRA